MSRSISSFWCSWMGPTAHMVLTCNDIANNLSQHKTYHPKIMSVIFAFCLFFIQSGVYVYTRETERGYSRPYLFVSRG